MLFGVLRVLAAAVTVCNNGEGKAQSQALEFVLAYAENQAEDYLTTQGTYRLTELVRERTGRRIGIQVGIETVLGDKKTVIEQLQFGGVDFARVPLSPLAEFMSRLDILWMPYLYTGRGYVWRTLEGSIGSDFMSSSDGSNLVALSWYNTGARSFYNTGRPTETLKDMRGLNIRVQKSGLVMDTIKALGAAPVPTTFGDVYSGLQIGRIDGAENSWPSYEPTRRYEVTRYFTLDEHTRVPELQLVAQLTWDKLSPEYQDIVRECVQESTQYERQLWAAREKVPESIVRKAGRTVTEFSPKEKARFQETATPMYEECCPECVDIIDAIVEAGDDGEQQSGEHR